MITRRAFIKGMGALVICVSLPMAAGAQVTPRIGYYGSLEHMADSVDWEALRDKTAAILNEPNALFDMTGFMTIPIVEDGERTDYKVRYTVTEDGTETEIVEP